MESVVDRFLRYVRIDTQSDHEGTVTPSTAKQLDLARLLVDELKGLGLQDILLDEYGFVTATLPANVQHKTPVIGWIAHMDTSPDFSDSEVKPQIVENYDGMDIPFGGVPGGKLSPQEFPELRAYRGQTLITTDGTTLLGADDKAGIAEIMAAVDSLVSHPEQPHGTFKVAFTPDEEIGSGAGKFDVQRFQADFAFTLDGGGVGQLSYENFNASGAKINIRGRSVHPGAAKSKMINASQVACEFNRLLPVTERPEFTEGYEGFFHLTGMSGNVEAASLSYLIRDHDRARFDLRKVRMQEITDQLNRKYGPGTVTLTLHDSYFNMKECVQPVIHIIDTAVTAMKALGIEPKIMAVRGGTDGAQFSYRGLPTPNLFTGGHNAHGPYEFVPVASMEKAVQVILKITELYSQG